MSDKTGIIYTRVSTSEQSREGVSLAAQEHRLRAYAEAKGITVSEVITDVASGKDLNREGVQEIIRRAESGETGAVLVYKLDRLTRRTRDLLYLVEDVLDKHDVALHSLSESIDTTTSQGRFFLTITGAMAQMERDLISERTSDALQELRRQGVRLGNPNIEQYDEKQIARMKRLRSRGRSYGYIAGLLGASKSGVYAALQRS